uniref:Uncharacterized protein n=1 Tax=viral metagenome TaxID=1070528 RepID=A0A6M3X596_9ZZZZ
MKPCKHLDYNEKNYPKCKLKTDVLVKFWDRLEGGFVTQSELEQFPNTAIKVQFCKKRGRINGIFQCYNAGELSCYEPAEEVR